MSELLRVENLKVHFPVSASANDKLFSFEKKVLKAVDGVSFTMEKGEVVALVGESGCGKSTVGKALVSLVSKTDGKVYYEGADVSDKKSMAGLRKNVQYIFQDPYSSLNPRMTVKTILSRPMEVFGLHKDPQDREKRLSELMKQDRKSVV